MEDVWKEPRSKWSLFDATLLLASLLVESVPGGTFTFRVIVVGGSGGAMVGVSGYTLVGEVKLYFKAVSS